MYSFVKTSNNTENTAFFESTVQVDSPKEQHSSYSISSVLGKHQYSEGREGGWEGGREGGREGGCEGGCEGGREGGREGGCEGGREGGRV